MGRGLPKSAFHDLLQARNSGRNDRVIPRAHKHRRFVVSIPGGACCTKSAGSIQKQGSGRDDGPAFLFTRMSRRSGPRMSSVLSSTVVGNADLPGGTQWSLKFFLLPTGNIFAVESV
jgi:hypothetical protein